MPVNPNREHLRTAAVHRIAAKSIAAARRRRRRRAGAAVFGLAALIVGLRGPNEIIAAVKPLAERWSFLPEPSCAEVPERYERAVRSRRTGWESLAFQAFDRARTACERRAVSAPSAQERQACGEAATTFTRAWSLKQAELSLLAMAPSGGSRIGMSGAGIVGSDDSAELVERGRDMAASCGG